MSSTWWQVEVSCRGEDTDAVAAVVVHATGQAVSEPAPGLLRTSTESGESARHLAGILTHQFAGLTVEVAEVERVDWSTKWRDGMQVRTFGGLVLAPSWLAAEVDHARPLVVIDPEMAFGSGEHGSTRGALTLLERHLREGDRVLDLGSGSGILAIAAAKLGARLAIGIEVDPDAIPVAETNAARNGVVGTVSFLPGDAAELAVIAGPAEIVLSNILRSINVELLPRITATLVPGGIAIFAGMETSESSLFTPHLAEHRLTKIDEVLDAGWWSVAVRRP